MILTFQLTRSRGARPFSIFSAWRVLRRFQLTRSRGARPGLLKTAAAWTTFQLTRSRGARLTLHLLLRRPCLNFNSRAHVERDLGDSVSKIKTQFISTHALTWSATREIMTFTKKWLNFNSRAHVERDITFVINWITFENFNSRAHVERDKEDLHELDSGLSISTHALTWSATSFL